MSTTDDSRDHVREPKHDGTKGPAFRLFKRTFLNIARGKFCKDDQWSFFTCYMRTDEGGTGANAPAMPSQTGGQGGGANPAYFHAVRKRIVRQNEAYVFLYRCIDQ